MKACKHCWRVNLQDAKKCVGCGATEFLDIIEIEKEGKMTIQEFEGRVKVGLSEDMRILSEHTNLAPEGEEPVEGWNVYTYWVGLDGGMVGIQSQITDVVLEKLNEKGIDRISEMIQSARKKHEGLLTECTLDPLKDILYS